MLNNNVVLYNDVDKKKNITVKEYNKFVDSKDQKAIAEFIYKRLYSRYIKPFEFNNSIYKNEYKNGFSMMASSCLLIETLESFKQGIGDSNKKSRKLFKDFFTENHNFQEFNTKGDEIYKNIRCGILHQGETTNGWKINRKKDTSSSYDKKEVNANEFMENLKKSLEEYRCNLITEPWDSDLWNKCQTKMNKIIINTKG